MSKYVKMFDSQIKATQAIAEHTPKNSAIVHDLWNDAIWTAILVSWRFTKNDNGTWLM
jgi:hypothetical protein